MKQIRALMAGATVALLPCIFQPSLAVTFGQTAVRQDKLIAIAVPHASGYYSLIVLEQLSDKKPCWRESGSKPTQVEPLLVNFNFTGICGRSTDSNGYSLRVAGQDLGITHRLSLQKRDDDLVLLGMPSSEKSKPIEVGRTHGIRPGFLKIDLSPGWQFAKRTYSGKTLGHVYLSRGTQAPIYQAQQQSSGKPPDNKLPDEKLPDSKLSNSKPPDSKTVDDKNLDNSKDSKRLPVKSQPSSKSVEIVVKPTQPDLFPGKPIQPSATPASATPAQNRRQQAASSAQTRQVTPHVTQQVTPPTPSLPHRQTLSSRSSRIIPIQLTRSKPIPSQLPVQPSVQPSVAKPSNKLYQVMVVATDSAQQDKVRDKMPNAFRTSYKGKTVMQVGLFSDRGKAESLQIDLKREGFKVLLTQKKVGKTAALIESEGRAIATNASTEIGTSYDIGTSTELGAITVPTADAPIGNVKGAKDVYEPQGYLIKASALPPPPSPNATESRYRVIVPAQSDNQKTKIRSLVPDAFQVRYKGQSVMQVGSFASMEEASPVMRLMEQHGFTPLTDSI
jgi:Protein of unknown function (DUF3747)